MEWTNDLILEFLNLYQNEPSLWNALSPEHKNKNDAFEAWIRIKTKLRDGSIPIKDIKKKKDNLMSTYRRQRSKVLDSMVPGSGADQIYKPEWPFYNIMATFLNDVYVPRKSRNPEDINETEDYENTSVDDEMNHNIDEVEKGSFVSDNNLPKKKNKKSKLHEDGDINKRLEEAYSFSKQMNQDPDIDECSLYCVLLYKKLRVLKESTREIAMMEVDRLIYNLKQQEKQLTLSSSRQPQNSNLFIPQQPYLQSPIMPNLQSQQYLPHSQLLPLLYSQLTPLFQQAPLPQPSPVHQQTSHRSSPVDKKPPLQ